jgi:hypothetical protein
VRERALEIGHAEPEESGEIAAIDGAGWASWHRGRA